MALVTKGSETIAAVATGGVVSAIGVVRMSGEDAIRIAEARFFPADGKPLSAHRDRQLVYGRLTDTAGEVIDLCLCTISHAPQSYTGENTAELQCHGSPVVLREVLESLFSAGARQALAGEFTKRAFLNGRMDLTEAEAVIDLIDAETPRAAKNAAAQLDGAVSRACEGVYSALTDMCSHYHAVLDYPDEEIPDFTLASYINTLRAGKETLDRLLSTHRRGAQLEKGVRTAILGKPNAGKSSLLNALLGYERAIVTDIPGTTRDTVSERCILGGVAVKLTDTAGVHESEDTVERLGIERSRRAAESAELVLAVFDRSREWTAEDADILSLAEGAAHAIAVINKADLPAAWEMGERFSALDAAVTLSAATGEGLDALEREIGNCFPLPDALPGEILTNARQAEAIGRAADYMGEAISAMESGVCPDAVLTECEGALEALSELTGRSVREDVTQKIFSRFCVGK